MRQINYKSDFDFILRLYDSRGDEIGWPDYDWSARFYIPQKTTVYTVSCIGGVCENCFNDNGQIHVVMNNHGLMPGRLSVTFTAYLPADIYPDSDERIVVPVPLDIELIRAAAPCPDGFEVEVMLPYINIKWEDLTPEQIAELQKPASEAAKRLETFVAEANEAERTRVDNEASRTTAEEERAQAETLRESAETKRDDAEAVRESNETGRIAAEKSRVAAEQARVTEFAGFKDAIDAKQDKIKTTEDLNLSEENLLSLTERAKQRLFDDLFLKAAGAYGSIDHGHYENGVLKPYCLNGIWLTYDEALEIYTLRAVSGNIQRLYSGTKIKTNFPLRCYASVGSSSHHYYADLAFRSTQIEVANVTQIGGEFESTGFSPAKTLDNVFSSNKKLHTIVGVVSIGKWSAQSDRCTIITDCPLLRDVRIYQFRAGILDGLQKSPLLSLESFQYLIANSTNVTWGRTVYVHADVYAKLADPDNTEWHQVLTDALEKNIAFATV